RFPVDTPCQRARPEKPGIGMRRLRPQPFEHPFQFQQTDRFRSATGLTLAVGPLGHADLLLPGSLPVLPESQRIIAADGSSPAAIRVIVSVAAIIPALETRGVAVVRVEALAAATKMPVAPLGV